MDKINREELMKKLNLTEEEMEKVALVKRVYSRGFYRTAAKDEAQATCVFAKDELPKFHLAGWGKESVLRGQANLKYRFVVRPCNCWGRKGAPIYSEWID